MATERPHTRAQLAAETRKRFVAEAGRAMTEISSAVQERLTALMNEAAPNREMQIRRDAWTAYQRARGPWLDGTVKAWQKSMAPPTATARARIAEDALQLVDTDVTENKILASRLTRGLIEKVSGPMDDLRVRIKQLENTEDFSSQDVFRPEVLMLALIEQWAATGMPRDSWSLVHDASLRLISERFLTIYNQSNDFLIHHGVLPTIQLKDRVKLLANGKPFSSVRGGLRPPKDIQAQNSTFGIDVSGFGTSAMGSLQQRPPAPPAQLQRRTDEAFGGRLGWAGDAPGSGNSPLQAPPGAKGPDPASGGQRLQSNTSGYGQAHDETRMLTATTPLARARSRAQGVMGQLKRLLIGRIGPEAENTSYHVASPALAAAIAVRPAAGRQEFEFAATELHEYTPAGVARVATRLRDQTTELKKKAETKGEKATIEIVALMFQAILQEDRIPPSIRVWFARLQMPVLRVALEEPDFFSGISHPARQLIDRMGSCVMGFEASEVQGGALENEVKRVVQVIEQYPETGKRVYQLVYDEFQKFMAKFLTEKGNTQKIVSVAQQVEQKETLTIQYTIEMRNMLREMPVREEIREFLFKVWAEVLAVAAVRKGPQHAETLDLKKSSTDLVWAASAKPNRSDRARVIADLPKLLQRLRSGMTLLGLAPSVQDGHVKTVSDTLADAFMSKTQAIPQAQIEVMAKRLANLEDFVSEDGMGDLPLDADSIEIMLGIDASTIDVVADGGSKPSNAMLAWAAELQVGAWFTLDHSNQVKQVQFAWRSDRKHLNLFASTDGHSYLIQAGRLAAYLQAGLLLPQEEETLTVRATRDALAKLEANPERLLN